MIQKKLISRALSLEDAAKVLEKNGYIVIKDDFTTISNKEIVDVFYRELYTKLPQEAPLLAQANEVTDLAAVERFQGKAKSLGIKKSEANKLLLHNIKAIFNNFDYLGLKECPRSLSFLTTNGSWIFKKLLEISHKKRIMFEESGEAQEYFDSLCETEDEAYKDLRDRKTKQLLGK